MVVVENLFLNHHKNVRIIHIYDPW